MIQSIHIELAAADDPHRTGLSYRVTVTDTDGTSTESVTAATNWDGTKVEGRLSGLYNAVCLALVKAELLEEANRLNPTPGLVVRGGKKHRP